MNQVADGKENVKCSQKTANSKVKSKKTKDPSESNIENPKLNQETLSEALSNTLHLNNINNSLSNGTCDHSKQESPKDSNDLYKVEGQEEISENVSKKNKDLPDPDEDSISTKIDEVISNEQDPLEKPIASSEKHESEDEIQIISYESELQMPEIMRLIQKDLSEPYSIYTYRYFIHNWPKLCFLATHEGKCIGAIVCKLDMHRNVVKRGYIAMLAVDEKYRKRKIGSKLVRKAIQAMINDNADEVVLETEITNKPALKLYENLGFVRDKRLFRYYLNGVDALRLKLWLR